MYVHPYTYVQIIIVGIQGRMEHWSVFENSAIYPATKRLINDVALNFYMMTLDDAYTVECLSAWCSVYCNTCMILGLRNTYM
jgi:hypothetical protein